MGSVASFTSAPKSSLELQLSQRCDQCLATQMAFSINAFGIKERSALVLINTQYEAFVHRT